MVTQADSSFGFFLQLDRILVFLSHVMVLLVYYFKMRERRFPGLYTR